VYLYADSQNFQRRKGDLARESFEHRMVWRDDIDRTIDDLKGFGASVQHHALMAEHLGEEFDENHVRATVTLFGNQLEAAQDRGVLNPELLADAFGVATWAIGAAPDEEPTARQLSYLADPFLRVGLAMHALTVGA
jgi:hypothetical protein